MIDFGYFREYAHLHKRGDFSANGITTFVFFQENIVEICSNSHLYSGLVGGAMIKRFAKETFPKGLTVLQWPLLVMQRALDNFNRIHFMKGRLCSNNVNNPPLSAQYLNFIISTTICQAETNILWRIIHPSRGAE